MPGSDPMVLSDVAVEPRSNPLDPPSSSAYMEDTDQTSTIAASTTVAGTPASTATIAATATVDSASTPGAPRRKKPRIRSGAITAAHFPKQCFSIHKQYNILSAVLDHDYR